MRRCLQLMRQGWSRLPVSLPYRIRYSSADHQIPWISKRGQKATSRRWTGSSKTRRTPNHRDNCNQSTVDSNAISGNDARGNMRFLGAISCWYAGIAIIALLRTQHNPHLVNGGSQDVHTLRAALEHIGKVYPSAHVLSLGFSACSRS